VPLLPSALSPFLFLITRPPPTSTLFPYTTLFRSRRQRRGGGDLRRRPREGAGGHLRPRALAGGGHGRGVEEGRHRAQPGRALHGPSGRTGRWVRRRLAQVPL